MKRNALMEELRKTITPEVKARVDFCNDLELILEKYTTNCATYPFTENMGIPEMKYDSVLDEAMKLYDRAVSQLTDSNLR
jgi:hypothetical protein